MSARRDPNDPPVVLITGAAGGLGVALVKAFAADGWHVVAGTHRSPLPPNTTAALSLLLDVTDDASIKSAVASCISRYGRIDALINNAGITVDNLIPALSVDDWDRCVAVCLKGAFLCSRAVLPQMVKQRGGHIINIGSFSGRSGKHGQAAYAAAKSGLVALTQSIAREYGSRKIQANVVLPGAMLTGMTSSLTQQDMAAFASANVLGRMTDPNEVAPFICHIARLDSASGQVFQLDSRIARWS
jgi:3-oxoacyl-[acyl-carrier protein] reductase